MLRRFKFGCVTAALVNLGLTGAGLPAMAEPAAVHCVVQPDGMSANVSVSNPLSSEASCRATCTFATATYDDKPQIICSGPVAPGKESELCVLHAKNNRLTKFVEGSADCRGLQ